MTSTQTSSTQASRQSTRIAALVLAAGRGARFGNAEVPKPLARVAGETLVARTTRVVAAAGADPVIVVVGHRGDAVADAVPERTIVVRAPDWQEGVSASIRAGIETLIDPDDRPRIDALLLMPVDQPGIEVEHLAALIERYERSHPDAVAVRTADGHRRGAPALFARHVMPRLLELDGDVGARRLLREDGELAIEVVDLPRRALLDVDTAEALDRFVREASTGL